jgi:hypothetical protein
VIPAPVYDKVDEDERRRKLLEEAKNHKFNLCEACRDKVCPFREIMN